MATVSGKFLEGHHEVVQEIDRVLGSSQLSSSSQTLLSGFLAVISVNLVIVFYIIMAMKEPTGSEHQPDPAFLAEAKASISSPATAQASDDTQVREKEE